MKFIPILLMALFLWACSEYPDYDYFEGELPAYPVNMESFNTEYDDYNSTMATRGRFLPFCFSTNRLSQGGSLMSGMSS